MAQIGPAPPERILWRNNPTAVELGFDYYLTLLERSLKGETVSLVQSLRRFFRDELKIDLRETQARGLMHRDSSVFRDYVSSLTDADFVPNLAHWESLGIDRFLEWKKEFFLARDIVAIDLDVDTAEYIASGRGQGTQEPPGRSTVRISRVIRDSALSRFLKLLYDYQCQICEFTFSLSSGRRYAEAHHIRPLGLHHNGIDSERNMMVLCPNHHAMMDLGVIAIEPGSLGIISSGTRPPKEPASLRLKNHDIAEEFLIYHLNNIFDKV